MPSSFDTEFYRKLPILTSFAEVTESRTHVDVPQDWWIVIADVIGSTKAIEAGAYKVLNSVGVACIAAVTNFRKFDGMLRMVMDGSEAQATALQALLDAEYQDRKLVYGTHKSREALVTCIVQSYSGNHMHFVDGSDGGYAIAARGLKAQLANMKTA